MIFGVHSNNSHSEIMIEKYEIIESDDRITMIMGLSEIAKLISIFFGIFL